VAAGIQEGRGAATQWDGPANRAATLAGQRVEPNLGVAFGLAWINRLAWISRSED